jgi:transcription antitermination factor NusG
MTLGNAPIGDFVGGRWHVAQVRSGEEKSFARRMSDREIGYFVPMELVKRYDATKRMTRRFWRALFPSYTFFYGGDTERYRVLDSGITVEQKVISILGCALQDRLTKQLADLHTALAMNPVVAKPLAAGSLVRITDGPFVNHEGIVDYEGNAYVVLRVDVLGASTTFEIDRQLVELID